MAYIILKNATKTINKKTILNSINLELEKGRIYGFVGRNGSGKTMLFRAICGFMKLTSGDIIIDSKKLTRERAFPKDTGVIIETPGFLPQYSGYKNLQYLASINNKIGNEEIRNALKLVGLDDSADVKVKKYSLGMRQRLGVAQAIMENPKLLILDEPTNALDKDSVKMFHELMLNLKARGTTILIASHHEQDIKALANTIYEMDNGSIISTIKNQLKEEVL